MSARNIRLVLAFDGTGFHGWQVQPHRRTIQGAVQEAIRTVTGEDVNLIGSGRTDAGTHARALVANFRTASAIPARNLPRALNSILPPEVRVLSAARARPDFHARNSARSKTYRYQVYRGPVMPPHLAREHFHFALPLNIAKMQRAAALFEGRHDFASFAATQRPRPCAGRNTVRTVFRCKLDARGNRLVFTVQGDGFLHHMVRNMVGTLLEIGRGRMTITALKALFGKRDRRLAGFTAPSHGLILLKVCYR